MTMNANSLNRFDGLRLAYARETVQTVSEGYRTFLDSRLKQRGEIASEAFVTGH